MTDLSDLLSRIAAVLDDECDPVPEVVEPVEVVEQIDLNRVLALANSGRYGELTDREKLAYLDVLEGVYPVETHPNPDRLFHWNDSARGRVRCGTWDFTDSPTSTLGGRGRQEARSRRRGHADRDKSRDRRTHDGMVARGSQPHRRPAR